MMSSHFGRIHSHFFLQIFFPFEIPIIIIKSLSSLCILSYITFLDILFCLFFPLSLLIWM
jgi:hypothetical protein